jgi:hypothetical protein
MEKQEDELESELNSNVNNSNEIKVEEKPKNIILTVRFLNVILLGKIKIKQGFGFMIIFSSFNTTSAFM